MAFNLHKSEIYNFVLLINRNINLCVAGPIIYIFIKFVYTLIYESSDFITWINSTIAEVTIDFFFCNIDFLRI